MKGHKLYINEWKSVNDSVKKVSNAIINMMWYDSLEEKNPMIDTVLKVPFISGEFQFFFETVLGEEGKNIFGRESIKIRYKLYFFDDEDEYFKSYHMVGSSMYDEETEMLTINSALIEGDLDMTVTQDVYHELTHAFEYGNGMEKRETLYDKSVKLINSQELIPSAIGMIVYYTFPHEQDAFAHQFYGILHRNEIKDDFEVALQTNLKNYNDLQWAIRVYKGNFKKCKKEIMKILSTLGMNTETFNKRLHFGRKRFINKLKRVYQRHQTEMAEKSLTVETRMKKLQAESIILNEARKRYKDIKYDESPYWW